MDTEFDRWVGENNIPERFEYGKGWWDYVELVRRFASKFDVEDVWVVGHYVVHTPTQPAYAPRALRVAATNAFKRALATSIRPASSSAIAASTIPARAKPLRFEDRSKVEDHPARVLVAQADEPVAFVEPSGGGVDDVCDQETERDGTRLGELQCEAQRLLE